MDKTVRDHIHYNLKLFSFTEAAIFILTKLRKTHIFKNIFLSPKSKNQLQTDRLMELQCNSSLNILDALKKKSPNDTESLCRCLIWQMKSQCSSIRLHLWSAWNYQISTEILKDVIQPLSSWQTNKPKLPRIRAFYLSQYCTSFW